MRRFIGFSAFAPDRGASLVELAIAISFLGIFLSAALFVIERIRIADHANMVQNAFASLGKSVVYFGNENNDGLLAERPADQITDAMLRREKDVRFSLAVPLDSAAAPGVSCHFTYKVESGATGNAISADPNYPILFGNCPETIDRSLVETRVLETLPVPSLDAATVESQLIVFDLWTEPVPLAAFNAGDFERAVFAVTKGAAWGSRKKLNYN